jgi:hypothetical protein
LAKSGKQLLLARIRERLDAPRQVAPITEIKPKQQRKVRKIQDLQKIMPLRATQSRRLTEEELKEVRKQVRREHDAYYGLYRRVAQ